MKKSIHYVFLSLIVISIFSCSKDEPTPTPSYSKVAITNVTVINFTDNNNGSYWDGVDDADLYFRITPNGSTTSLFTLNTNLRAYDVDNTSVPISWAVSPNLLISNLSSPIDVDLLDYDNIGQDDYIGTCTYNFSNYTIGSNKYPASVTTQSGSNIVKLDLTWTN